MAPSSTIDASVKRVTTSAASSISPPAAEPSTATSIIVSMLMTLRWRLRQDPCASGTRPASVVSAAQSPETVTPAPPLASAESPPAVTTEVNQPKARPAAKR